MIRIFTSKTQSFGEKGEEEAASYLKKQGFSIIERNVPNKYGEIDIVARKGDMHYFFEVKAGKLGASIHPAENLTREKLRKVYIGAEYYALTHKIIQYQVQGIIVLFGDTGTKIEILALA